MPLSLEDRISVTHVCQVWREVATSFPSLWSQISIIKNRKLLALVLHRAGSVPVDLLDLHISDENDPILEPVIGHILTVRTLRVRFTSHPEHMTKGSRVYDVLRSPAPLIEKLAILGNPNASFTFSPGVKTGLLGGSAPYLREVQLMAGGNMLTTLRSLPRETMHQIKVLTLGGYRCRFSYKGIARVANILSNLHTLNFELRGWKDNGEPSGLSNLALRRINIIVAFPERLLLQDALPALPGWITVPEVRIAYTWPDKDWADQCLIPANDTALAILEVRVQGDTSLVSIRATTSKVVRVYTGIHQKRIRTLLEGNALRQVEVLVVSARENVLAAVASCQWPNLRRLLITADGLDASSRVSTDELICSDESTASTGAMDGLTEGIRDLILNLKQQDERRLEIALSGFSVVCNILEAVGTGLDIVRDPQWYAFDDEWISTPVFQWD